MSLKIIHLASEIESSDDFHLSSVWQKKVFH